MKIVHVTPTILPAPTEVIVETYVRDLPDGFWLEIYANRLLYDAIGPFETEGEALRAATDMSDMARSIGAVDMPLRVQ